MPHCQNIRRAFTKNWFDLVSFLMSLNAVIRLNNYIGYGLVQLNFLQDSARVFFNSHFRDLRREVFVWSSAE